MRYPHLHINFFEPSHTYFKELLRKRTRDEPSMAKRYSFYNYGVVGVGRLKNLPAPKSSAKKVRFLGGRTRFRGVLINSTPVVLF